MIHGHAKVQRVRLLTSVGKIYEKFHTPLGPVPVSERRTTTQRYLLHSLSNLNLKLFAKSCGFRIKIGQWAHGNELVRSQRLRIEGGLLPQRSRSTSENQTQFGPFPFIKCAHTHTHTHTHTEAKHSFTTYSRSQHDRHFAERPFV